MKISSNKRVKKSIFDKFSDKIYDKYESYSRFSFKMSQSEDFFTRLIGNISEVILYFLPYTVIIVPLIIFGILVSIPYFNRLENMKNDGNLITVYGVDGHKTGYIYLEESKSEEELRKEIEAEVRAELEAEYKLREQIEKEVREEYETPVSIEVITD